MKTREQLIEEVRDCLIGIGPTMTLTRAPAAIVDQLLSPVIDRAEKAEAALAQASRDARNASLDEAAGVIRKYSLQFSPGAVALVPRDDGEKSGLAYVDAILALKEDGHAPPGWQSREKQFREALKYYANPEIYKPHPHGPAFERRDLSYVAISALRDEQPFAAPPSDQP